MSAYNLYSTDKKLEQEGFWLDFGDFRVLLARAGGSNTKFAKTVEDKTRPYRRAVDQGVLSPAVAEKIMAESFAESVILGWQVQRDAEWVDGIDQEDGSTAPYNKENVIKILLDLPDLFANIRSEAERAANFRRKAQEEEVKNS